MHRAEKTLDCVYTNKAYRAFPFLHLGWSDHLSLFLTPAYHPIIKRHPPTIKAKKSGHMGHPLSYRTALNALTEGCFTMRISRNILQLCFFFKSCLDIVTMDRQTRVFPNRKPWMTKEVQLLPRECDAAPRSGDNEWYCLTRRPAYKDSQGSQQRED